MSSERPDPQHIHCYRHVPGERVACETCHAEFRLTYQKHPYTFADNAALLAAINQAAADTLDHGIRPYDTLREIYRLTQSALSPPHVVL